LRSDSIASLPDEQNESRDHANHDKHPVLALETQKGEMLNEKLHRFRPLFVQDRHFSSKNILFLYFLSLSAGPVEINLLSGFARTRLANYGRD
jgi:hypothetical protein